MIESSFAKRNPLLTTCKNGVVNAVNTEILKKEFPEFWANLMKVGRRHGCNNFLNNFLKRHYKNDLHDDGTLRRLSQEQYIHMAIMYMPSE